MSPMRDLLLFIKSTPAISFSSAVKREKNKIIYVCAMENSSGNVPITRHAVFIANNLLFPRLTSHNTRTRPEVCENKNSLMISKSKMNKMENEADFSPPPGLGVKLDSA